MAKPISFRLLTFLLLSLSSTSPQQEEEQVADIHDLLPRYNLPRGLLPANVASYSFTPPSSPSSPDGFFSIKLTTPCYVHFDDQLVYYSTDISGKLGYGVVRDASGIQAKKLFIWLPVTGIQAGGDDGMVEFFVGSLSKKLPANEFDDVPACGSKANLRSLTGLDFI